MSCSKVRYKTSHQAKAALQNIRKFGQRDEDGKKPCRAYLCDDGCGYWHLTSQP